MRQSFKSSLKVGEHGQKIVADKLQALGFETKESSNKGIDLYFTSEGKEFSAEIKWDLYSEKSGNFAIETYNTKLCKPSGIMSTEADWWFHMDGAKKVYFARSSVLKEFVEKVKPKREIACGGDFNSSMLLYDMDIICKQCFKELTKENLLEEIKKCNLS